MQHSFHSALCTCLPDSVDSSTARKCRDRESPAYKVSWSGRHDAPQGIQTRALGLYGAIVWFVCGHGALRGAEWVARNPIVRLGTSDPRHEKGAIHDQRLNSQSKGHSGAGTPRRAVIGTR